MNSPDIPPRATVLAYHAIGDCPPEADTNSLFVAREALRAQMKFLSEHRQVVELQDLLDGEIGDGPPAVAITFDDAYRSVHSHAWILREHGFPATVFVPTAYVGDRNRWDPASQCPLEIMSVEELQQVQRWGIDLQSHGHAHIDMVSSRPPEVAADLAQSRQRLVDLCGRAPSLLAWPYHTGSPENRKVAAEMGFAAAFSIDRPGDGPYALARVQIAPSDNLAVFRVKTSGRYLRIRHSPLGAWGYGLIKPLVKRAR